MDPPAHGATASVADAPSVARQEHFVALDVQKCTRALFPLSATPSSYQEYRPAESKAGQPG